MSNNDKKMYDVFGRELKIGDTIVCFPHKTGKNLIIEKITGFYHSGYEINNGFYKMMSECLILKREDGTSYFDTEGLPYRAWSTNYKEVMI